ncbi:hypothetical protein [Paracoccus haeundaensis]|uniref:Uncharacterized protein n=1 Tax=Paracoccus haeundaensis TaxID=225362 RepID=A0A5C4R1N5_9RHOB|nr:hypothetical protein [Paracoccus haeundaensis]TNH37577.1 hypothetical protein FHD67_19575 [Paracoccus haeundaensis]
MRSNAEQSIFDYRLDSAKYTGNSESFEKISKEYTLHISHAIQERKMEVQGSSSSNIKQLRRSSTVERKDLLDEIASPAERQPNLLTRKSRLFSSFTPNYEWEGYVVHVDSEKFVVNLSDVHDEEGSVTDQAEFDLKELPEADQRRIETGSIVRWLVGLEILPNDQRQRVSRVHLRRLPVFTKHDVDSALEEAMSILQGMEMDDAS